MLKRVAAFFVLLYAGLWCLQQAPSHAAGWLPLAKASGGGGSPTFTGTASGVNASCGFSTTCAVTLTATGGVLVVAAGGQNLSGGASTISSIATSGACGAVSLTMDTNPSSPNNSTIIALAHGTVSSGSCTITATASGAGAFQGFGVAIGTLNNLASSTPGGTCNALFPSSQNPPYPCSSSITILSGGFAILGAGAATSSAFSNGSSTIAIDSQATGTGVAIAIGHSSTVGAVTPDISFVGFNDVSVAGGAWQ